MIARSRGHTHELNHTRPGGAPIVKHPTEEHPHHLVWVGVVLLVTGLSGGCSSTDDLTPPPGAPDASTVFGDGGGSATGDSNLAPEVSIQSPHVGQIFQEGDPITLTATAIDDRDSPEELSATWYSSIDGELVSMVPNQAGYVTFETVSLSVGNHTLTLSVIDSQSKVAQAHVEFVVNGAPAAPVVEITPESPHTSDDLDAVVVVPAVDPNRSDDEIYYSYQWYRDDELTDVTISKVYSQKTARGQIWRVEVRAKDPYGKGSLGTAEVEIANERPVCTSAVILPSSGWTDTDLTCECVEWSDGDPGDGAHDICTFLADGDVLAEGEDCALSHQLTEKGMEVTCVLTPHDGTDAGDPAETNTVTILNSPPSAPSVVMTPESGHVNTLFFCDLETPSVDPDGDDVSYEITWVVNGYENPGTTSEQVVPANLTSDDAGSPARGGDTLHCLSRGLDEEQSSMPGESAGVVLDNSAPEGGAVLVLPAQASELDSLTCQANGATDPDGDEITWLKTWFSNGVVLEGVTGDTLEAGTVTAGDIVTCSATPTDGQAEGATQQSKNQVVISNTAPTIPVVGLAAPDGYLGTATCVLEVPSEDVSEVSYEVLWTLNGELLVGPSWELTANEITACDVLTCQVTASDGIDSVLSGIASLQLPAGEACEDGDICTSHSCKPEGGCLSNFNEAPCDDGDACTSQDACNQGTCGGKPKSCDDSNPCTVDSCDTETGCLHAVDEQICNDGNPCTVDLCSPSTGACSWVSVGDGTGCNADDDGCSLADSCTGGFCLPGEPAPCGEGSGACKQVLCQSTGSDTYTCASILSDETVPCSDGFFCTVEDHCDGLGHCEGGPPRQCDQGLGSCLIGLCDETTNSCELFDREDGTSCDADANGCTLADSCIGGLCMAGPEVGCEELDSDCSLGSCVNVGSDLHSCELIAAPAGLPCEDDNYCTTSSACDGLGTCQETKALDCDELVGNQCRTGYCDPVTQACVVVKIPDGTPCEDGSLCSQVDTCKNGTCIGSGEVCVEERINVNVETDRQPAIGDLGFGRYVVQWGQSDSLEQLVSRLSDRLGSREGEEHFIPETSFVPHTFDLGIATHPSGEYLLLSFGGSYKCVQNANTNCSSNGRIYGVHYDVNGEILRVAQLWSLLGEKGSDGSLTSLELGHRVVPVAFDDVTFGCIVTTVTNGSLPTDPPAGNVYLYPIAGDLATGDRVLLLEADEVASERFAVARVSSDDQLQLTWISVDEGVLQSRRFDRYGNPLGNAWVAAVAGVGERLTSVESVTRPDGSVVVAWDVEVDDPEAADGVDTDIYLGLFQEDGAPVLEAPLQVNTQTSGLQLLRGLDVFTDGGLVLVFDDSKGDVSGWAVQARRFDPALTPLAPPERVNVIADGDQTLASVRVLGSGEWIVAFRGDDGGVWTRRFYKTGEPAVGALEVQVTTDGAGDQVSTDASWWGDRALVVHEGPLEGNGGTEIVGRLYDVSGQPMTSSFRVNDNLTSLQSAPSVTAGGDQFVVAWVEDAQDGSPKRVRARRVDLQGLPVGDGFDVATDLGDDQSQPWVAAAADGRFGITWLQAGESAAQVYVRTFDADGEPASEPQAMNAISGDEQTSPVIAVTGDDALIVVWETAPGGASKHNIEGRCVSMAGVPLTDVVELGAGEANSAEQVDPTVAVGLDGVGITCWQSSLLKGDGAKKGIGCQRFQTTDLSLLGPVIEVAPASTQDTSIPSVTALPSGELVVAFAVNLIDGDGSAVQVQRLTSTGTPTGPRVMVNRSWEGDQSHPRATGLSGAGVPFMITWQSDDQGDDGWDAYLRILKPE